MERWSDGSCTPVLLYSCTPVLLKYWLSMVSRRRVAKESRGGSRTPELQPLPFFPWLGRLPPSVVVKREWCFFAKVDVMEFERKDSEDAPVEQVAHLALL